jgi:pimeloyl-ACP methyl ester carboxylesterase
MAKLNLNGASCDYSEHGQGEPLVLVHGSASDYRTWQGQQESFGKHFRTVVYSRRYHWPNDRIAEHADYSMSEQVDDLATLLDSLDLAPAHLVGHSYGAFLCLLLAIRGPDKVRSLVLAEPPVVPLFVSNPAKPFELLELLLTRPRTAIAIMKFGARGIAPATKAVERGDMEAAMQILGTALLGRDFYRRLSESRLAQVRANAIRAEFLGSGLLPLVPDQVRSVRVPTLLITGQRSPGLFHRLTDRLEELLPHTERVVIPEASHIMHEDNPTAFNAAVLAFLARHGQAT